MTNRAMKESGTEWIGKVPEKWDIQRLKNILIERKENNKPQRTDNILSLMKDRGVIPYSEKGDVGNKSKTDLTQYKLAYPGDIVLNSMNVIIGSVGLSKYFGAVSPVYYMLRPRFSKDFVEYYNYIFQTEVFQKSLIGYGNGIMEHRMRIPMNNLNNVLLPVPPSHEQQKIAAFLDEKVSHIDNIIEDTKESIESLKAYKQSLITETVTNGLNPNVEMKDSGIDWVGKIPTKWSVGKLKYLSEIKRGASPRPIVEFLTSKEEGCNWIKIGDTISGEKYINSTSQNITKKGAEKSVEILPGDLIMSNSMSIGRPYISKIQGYIHDGWLGFQFDGNKINSEWLYYMLTASIESLKRLSQGTTVNNLNIERVKSLVIPFYDIKEQLQITSYLNDKVDSIDSLISEKEKLFFELEAYKKSLIFEYVTGKKEVK